MKSFHFLRSAVVRVSLCAAVIMLGELASAGLWDSAAPNQAFAQTIRRAPSRTLARPSVNPRSTANGLPPIRTGNAKTLLADAQRSLKIGSSYREARNYDLAQKYIQRGIELAQRAGNRYWEATGYEYLGLVYRDIGDRTAALSALQRASDIFSSLIKQPDGSQRATQALIDDINRNDRSRPPSSAQRTYSAPMPQQYPARTSPQGFAQSDLERERTLNRQLNDRILGLESKIRALEDRTVASPGAAPSSSMSSSAFPQSSSNALGSESSPGMIARTMPRQVPDGGKPQAEFAPFSTDKKPTRTEPVRSTTTSTARAVVVDYYTLPTFVLQIGIGAGYNLNTKGLVSQRTVNGNITTDNVVGNSPLISFPMLSVSGDFFLTPNFSLGLMYAYFPGPNLSTSSTVTTPTTTATRITETATSYHLLTLRPAYHFVRDRNVDIYAGLSLGTMLNFNPLFSPLSFYGGVLVGAQVNVSRQVGLFLELSGGGTYLGNTAFENATPAGNPLIGIGAYGRLGLAVGF